MWIIFIKRKIEYLFNYLFFLSFLFVSFLLVRVEAQQALVATGKSGDGNGQGLEGSHLGPHLGPSWPK